MKGVSGFCLLTCSLLLLANAIATADSQWEFRKIDRNIGSLRPVNREEKKYEVIELHVRDKSERSEWFLIVFFSLDNAITSRQWEFSN